MIDISNPYEVQKFAEQEGIPISAVYDMGIKFYTSEIHNMPGNPSLYLKRGDCYFENELYDLAIKDYTKFTELAPSDPNGFHYLADCYQKIGNFQEALKNFNKATEFTEYDRLDSVYYHRAYLYFDNNQYQEALTDINKAIELRPNSISEYYRFRSRVYYALHDDDKALEDFDYWKAARIESLKKMLEKYPQREKEDMLFGLFSQLNNDEQNEFLAELAFQTKVLKEGM